MAIKIQAIKGMNDLLPEPQKDWPVTSAFWQAFERIAQAWMADYGYRFIRTPIVETTALFVRAVGEETDVVGKEMYTFDDFGESLSLRPEGTASCLRAVVEHNLLYQQPQKLWYMGPMFRRERPQKGRYRQFHQIGAEALGYAGADIDAEIIAMCADFWKRLGIENQVRLEINCLGDREERARHKEALVAYLRAHEAILDEDSRRRVDTNPLRVLDTKNPALQEMANDAPRLLDYLGEASRAHYEQFKRLLTVLDVAYTENPRLVRGLDYYNLTVFEWVTDALGAQGTVCGGGRYDGLIESLGGKSTPSIGFGMGMERLLLLVAASGSLKADDAPDVYAMYHTPDAVAPLLQAAQQLRQAGFSVACHHSDQKLASQLKRANASGARFALIIAQEEARSHQGTLKDLRGPHAQVTLPIDSLATQLHEWTHA